ncbi:MAG: patatin-like phospholipase family protein [Myxococcaceae bacterium]|nr:patatin-like phospholipase family protein [Myxococcaceae bacterium]
MRLRERFEIIRPLEELESALVRGALENPSLVTAHEEAILRTALSLARLYKVHQDGREVGVGACLSPFREDLARRLTPVLLPKSGRIERAQVLPQLRELKETTLATRDSMLQRFKGRLTFDAVDRELRHKSLVLVLGGGGGSGYVYLGVMALLDEYGLTPKLLSGTSIGAILSLFRSRMRRFEQDEVVNIVRTLSWRRLFRVVSTENKYGLPAALRLFLRSGIGRWFGVDTRGGEALTLAQLPIKTLITVSGIRAGKLPHPLEFYEKLIAASPKQLLNPLVLPKWLGALWEFATHPEILTRVTLGQDEGTDTFDSVDAAGFSSALPGIIHYDVLRDDARMHAMLKELFAHKRIFRLVDGGLVDNVPSKAAWRAVHKGEISTRNTFILALNGFATKLATPLWIPLQRIAELNVARSRPWAHLTHDFKRSLNPLSVVPRVDELLDAITWGRAQVAPHLPFITRMLAPLPRLG